MARIALIDPSGRAATTVEAVLGRTHEIVVRSRVHAPGDVDLVIADLRHTDLVDGSTLRGLTSFGPVLVLIDRREPIPPTVEERRDLRVLRKPFDAFELKLKVDQLLRPGASARTTPSVATPKSEEEETAWLEFPYVPAPAGAVLRRAAKLTAPLWILGEPGCGRRRVALAVCRLASPPLPTVTLYPDQDLDSVLARHADAEPFALIVAEVESRPLAEQERLASVLAGTRGFRLIATSVDDPADRVLAGTFSRDLYRQLVGLAVQISPLRERPIAIPPLAQAIARKIARRLGSQGELSFSSAAMTRLQTYMWPGNVVELEAVLTRTLTTFPESELDGRTIEADDLLFTLDDAARSRAGTKPSTTEHAAERHAAEDKTTPAALSAAVRAAADRAADTTRAPAAARSGEQPNGGTFEVIFGGLAHDLRNPMTAIKTFASAVSSGRVDAEGAHELGSLAVEACDRLEGYLQELQRYGSFGVPEPETIDVLELLRQAAAEVDASAMLNIDASERLAADVDPYQLRFVLDNVLAEMLAVSGEKGSSEVTLAPERTLVFSVTAADGVVTKLRKLSSVTRQPISWRIVLARAVATRNGCDVEVESAGDEMTIRCRLPGAEVKTRGQQTSRIDR